MQITEFKLKLRFLITPLNADLNPIYHLLVLLGAHHIFHVSRIIIIYLSCSRVPVSRIQKSLQRSTIIPPASWGVVFHYPG